MSKHSGRWAEGNRVPTIPWKVCTHSFIRHSLRTYYVPGTGIGAVVDAGIQRW